MPVNVETTGRVVLTPDERGAVSLRDLEHLCEAARESGANGSECLRADVWSNRMWFNFPVVPEVQARRVA